MKPPISTRNSPWSPPISVHLNTSTNNRSSSIRMRLKNASRPLQIVRSKSTKERQRSSTLSKINGTSIINADR